MGLGQEAEVGEVRELAADGGRRQVDEIARLQRLRADRHRARGELLDHGPEDRLLPVLHFFQHSRWESANQVTAPPELLAAGTLLLRRRLGRKRCRAVAVLAEDALGDPARVLAALLGVRGLGDVVAVVARTTGVLLLAG